MSFGLKQHPLSAAFPAMNAQDFQALKDSIEAIGVQNAVTLYEGMVIDGWHRYTAAQAVGLVCQTVELGDVDPRDFVLAQNKARRHITQAQLAMATTAVYGWYPAGNPSLSQSRTECGIEKTSSELASIAGVGQRTIEQAKVVQAKATPEVQDAVKRGEIGLVKAAAIAKLPQQDQAAALVKPMPKPAKAESLPPPPPTPPPAMPADEGPTPEEIAAAERAAAEELAALCQIALADDKVAAALAEAAKLRAMNRVLQERNDGLMNEKVELIKRIKTLQRKLDKLEQPA